MNQHVLRWTSSLDCQTFTPGQDGYDRARRVYNTMIDRFPLAIVRCQSDEHIRQCLSFARRDGIGHRT